MVLVEDELPICEMGKKCMSPSTARAVSIAVFVQTICLIGLIPTAHADDLRFVFIAHGKPPVAWWTVLKNGVDRAAEELDVKVEFAAPDTFDMDEMSKLIDAAVASSPDGLVVTIPDAIALKSAIENAVKSGVPVVSVNSGSEAYERLGIRFHIGQPEYQAGLAAGRRMRDTGVESAVCLNQEGGNIAGQQRCQGFLDGFGGAVEELELGYEINGVEAAVTAYFEANPNVSGALVLGPTASAPTIRALDKLGLLGTMTVATFDFTPAVLKAIEAGNIAFAVDQQPYLQGYLPVFHLKKYAELGVQPIGTVMTGPAFVSADNVAQVIELSQQGLR